MGRNGRSTGIPGITVYPRGKTWSYVVLSEPDLLSGKKSRFSKGGFETFEAALTKAIKTKEWSTPVYDYVHAWLT